MQVIQLITQDSRPPEIDKMETCQKLEIWRPLSPSTHLFCSLIGCCLPIEQQVFQWRLAALHVTRSWPPWQVKPSLWLEKGSPKSDSYFMLFRRGSLGWWWLGSMWGNSKGIRGNERNISSRLWLIEETQLDLHHLLEQQLIIYLPTGGKPCSWSKYSNWL